jgi:peptidoglycan-associated lipoprotein
MTTNCTLSTATLAAVLVALSTVSGCGHDEPKPAASPTTTTTTTTTAVALSPASPGKTNSTVYLSDRLRKACGILPEDRDVLALVAQCLTTGALKGRSLKLVGRADPRGTTEYNMALGERRANAVLKYLTALGVNASQLSDTSRGSLDAKAGDEAVWKQDRRVDLDLVETAP